MNELLLIVIGLSFYFLPSMIALSQHHPQSGSIVVINFFLGWSLIGWVVALAMAASSPSAQIGAWRCPYCAEAVQPAAIVCRHCGRDLAPLEAAHQEAPSLTDRYSLSGRKGKCSECGNEVLATAERCPFCRTVFAAPPERVS